MKKDILFLDCTRLDGSKKLVSRNNANSFMAVEEQVKRISDIFKNARTKRNCVSR